MFTIKQIFKESIGVLLFAAILSLIAGLFLRNIEEKLVVILPLVIILPALNDMIGDFGIIMTSKITTALYEKKFGNRGFHSRIVKHLFKEMLPISVLSAIYISFLATFIANFRGFDFNAITLWKIIGITLVTTITLVVFTFIISIFGSLYAYKKKADPDDVLIPITTSVADLGSLIVFSLLVSIAF